MNLQQVKRARVGDQVFGQLKDMIENQVWAVGERIPSERELSETLGVSHATVRQALQKLNALGLLETRVGNGSFVKALSPQNCLDLLQPDKALSAKAWQDVIEFREMLEIYAVRIAANRATEQEIEQLRENYRQMTNRTDAEGYADLDVEFHNLIGRITRNDMVIRSYEILNSLLKRSIVDEINQVGITRYEDHYRIIDAIARHKGELAAALMSVHLLGLSKAKPHEIDV